jgi:hypothetical protein
MKRAALAFAVLTLAMMWPLVRHIARDAPPHQDVYFNMWRLRWIAHALPREPLHLFDANIFHPEPRTLALSDAMLVEGIVAAPLVWAGMPPVLLHNVMMLLAIFLSALAMFALTRYLTGSRGAAAVAAIIFAYAPYRFEHLMHMELQWTAAMPLAFLALHRTLDSGRWRHGVAFGACLAAQMLSCIYYGIFLGTLIGLAGLLLIAVDRRVPWRRAAGPIAAGLVLALAIGGAYAAPYARVHAKIGDRPIGDVETFSATPASYLSVPADNWLYGNPGRPGRPERRLFPGTIAILLAIVGLLLRMPPRRALVYLCVGVAAFDLSLGFNGLTYPLLYKFFPVYRSLRAMARAGIFVVMALAVLAAYGYAALVAGRGVRTRFAICALLCGGLAAEYASAPRLVPFPSAAPQIYRVLSLQPRGVVAELPGPRSNALPGLDAAYAYFSTFYWFPLVNGYSGNYPASYLARIERLSGFPDDRSLRQLRADGVRYVIVHAGVYTEEAMAGISERMIQNGMTPLGRFEADGGPAWLFVTASR